MSNQAVQAIDKEIKKAEHEYNEAKAFAARLPLIEADLAALNRVRERLNGGKHSEPSAQTALHEVFNDMKGSPCQDLAIPIMR